MKLEKTMQGLLDGITEKKRMEDSKLHKDKWHT